MTTERTHQDLKVGVPYPNTNGYAELTYFIKKAAKGQSTALNAFDLQLPKQLSVICGMQCALLKGKDTCPNHGKAGVVHISGWTGELPSMVSFVVARVSPYIRSKADHTIWNVTLDQVTSRSINHVIDLERARTWDEATPEAKNVIIQGLHDTVWPILNMKESRSAQLTAVARNAENRAQKLFKQLLNELAEKYGDARWYSGDPLIAFENPHTFLASLTAATQQYLSYASHNPSQLAMLHELALKEGRKVNPELVKEIMGCYTKVREAEKHEPKPYVWDQKVVEKVLLSQLFKPSPAEVLLPF